MHLKSSSYCLMDDMGAIHEEGIIGANVEELTRPTGFHGVSSRVYLPLNGLSPQAPQDPWGTRAT